MNKEIIVTSNNGFAIEVMEHFNKKIQTEIDSIDEEIENLTKSIYNRAKLEDSENISDEDLFDVEMDSEQLSFWDMQAREGHAYDLGTIKSLTYQKKQLQKIIL